MPKSGYSDRELLEYIAKHCDEIECELNGEEYKEPKKRDRYFCMGCKLRKTVDYERSILTCTKCGVFEYYPVYVSSYNHTMQPSRRKCIYKRYDNFKVILNQFFYGGKRVVPDDIMEMIRDEIHDETNILYNYTIPMTIPILECILKRKGQTIYKDSIYYIYFKLSGLPSPHIITKEYNMMLKVFDVVTTIYDKYKPKGRKSFLIKAVTSCSTHKIDQQETELPLRFETNINNERYGPICQVHTQAEDPLETEGTRMVVVSNN